MKAIRETPRNRKKQPRVRSSEAGDKIAHSGYRLAPFLVVLLTVYSFLPVLGNDFVNWDDHANLLGNPSYRGLGLAQVRWMFTTFHMGHYQPLSWLTLGLDYCIWGLNPFGYHLTNLILHAATAAVFFFIVKQLLCIATARDEGEAAVWLGATVAALVFAAHPLRVESVAWATERKDVLSGLFYTLTVLVYLSAWRAKKFRLGCYCAVLVFYVCALLSKSMTVSLVVVLSVLDVYPLRRLGGKSGWWSQSARAVYWEKLPLVLLSVVASAIAFRALGQVENMASMEILGVKERLTASAYSLWFYFWKTLIPFNLSPLYEMPSAANLSTLSFMLSYLAVIVAIVLGILLRRRVPGLAAVGIAYSATLLPVLGIFQNGPQIVADRYSYLACMGWAVLAGAGAQSLWKRAAGGRMRRQTVVVGVSMIAVIIFGMALLTRRQAEVWHDSERLWKQAVDVTEGSAFEAGFGHNEYGLFLAQRGEFEEAIKQFTRAIELNSRSAKYHNNLGVTLARGGRLDEAMRHYLAAIRIQPHASFHNNLGAALLQRGQFEQAVKHYREALKLSPDESEIHFNLGNALARNRQLHDAEDHYKEAIRLRKNYAEAFHNLGRVVAAQGLNNNAIGYFREAVRISPRFAAAHESLGRALAEQGNSSEATEHYQEALRILRSNVN